jgi:hypothetical protein
MVRGESIPAAEVLTDQALPYEVRAAVRDTATAVAEPERPKPAHGLPDPEEPSV